MFPSKEFFYVQSLMMVRWYLQHPLRNLWFQAKNTKLNLLLWLRSRPHQWGHRWDYATKAELLPWSILIWGLVLWFYIPDLGWHQMILTILEEEKIVKICTMYLDKNTIWSSGQWLWAILLNILVVWFVFSDSRSQSKLHVEKCNISRKS